MTYLSADEAANPTAHRQAMLALYERFGDPR
jgi:hypothetical protein